MVTLPKEFVATKFPGYFWHTVEQKLYTLKVTGVLRPLKKQPPNRYNHYKDMYAVSHKGQRRGLLVEKLKQLQLTNSVFPVQPE